MLHHSCTHWHSASQAYRNPALLNPSLAPSPLALCDDVTFSPFLKVETRGFSPHPDTPDNPVSPYLPSPDEVTACGDVVEYAGAIKPSSALTRCLPLPPFFSFVCSGKFPPHPHILNAAWHPLTAPFITAHIQRAPINPHTSDLDSQSAACELEG